jgi:hypothetical protein
MDCGLRAEARTAPYTSREFLYKLGEYLWTETEHRGILTAAYLAEGSDLLPGDRRLIHRHGSVAGRHRDQTAGQLDVIGDIIESANVVIRKPSTATIVLGGGTPKNFINQASVQAEFYDDRVGGHKYAIQIVTDAPVLRRRQRIEPGRSAELGQALDRIRKGHRCIAMSRSPCRWSSPRLKRRAGRPRTNASVRSSIPSGRVMAMNGQPLADGKYQES